MIANKRRRAILTSGPIALAIADMTTCKPGEHKQLLVCRTFTGKIRFKDNLNQHILDHGWKGNYCLLETPETSLSGLRTRTVLRVDRSGPVAFPSSDLGISIGRNLPRLLWPKVCISRIPWHHYNEVHDVPGISKVGIWMHHKTQCNNLCAHLHRKNYHEIRFKLLLKEMTK